MEAIKEHDEVILNTSMPQLILYAGAKGTVVFPPADGLAKVKFHHRTDDEVFSIPLVYLSLESKENTKEESEVDFFDELDISKGINIQFCEAHKPPTGWLVLHQERIEMLEKKLSEWKAYLNAKSKLKEIKMSFDVGYLSILTRTKQELPNRERISTLCQEKNGEFSLKVDPIKLLSPVAQAALVMEVIHQMVENNSMEGAIFLKIEAVCRVVASFKLRQYSSDRTAQ